MLDDGLEGDRGVTIVTSEARPLVDGPVDTPTVSVAICSNRPSGLAAAVASVLANAAPPFELLVIAQGEDVGWARGALAELPEQFRDDPRLRIVHDPQRGVSRARNVAVREAVGDLILFTDDDCIVAPDWVAAHVACFRERPDVSLVYATVTPPDWYTGAEGMVPTFDPSSNRNMARGRRGVVFGMTANMGARRTLFERVGPFDEILGVGAPLRSAEDLDLALRTYAAGLLIHADHRPVVVHAGGVRSLGRESRELWQRDGIGLGAAVVKAIRSGQWRAAAAPSAVFLSLWRDVLVKIVRGRRPYGLAMTGLVTAGALDGFARGLRQPLKRTGSGYVFTAHQ
jgi:GT2 family glycosyltransferase